jgi:hypothetical protein
MSLSPLLLLLLWHRLSYSKAAARPGREMLVLVLGLKWHAG